MPPENSLYGCRVRKEVTQPAQDLIPARFLQDH
jgi:hypothetical protein